MTHASGQLPHRVAIVRILAVLLAILLVHWIDAFGLAYFAVLGAGAALLLASQFAALPGLPELWAIDVKDRLAIWIVLAVFAVIGYLHNANTWVAAGVFNRPTDVSLWKTELVLSISVAAPLVHWMAAVLRSASRQEGGRVFAREFALYVNFSGVAIVLWTGAAELSLTTLAAVFALAVLAELTLYASN